jgi:two-component system, chemotaxis family, protein-glutamate methylesterase/glutaminase
MSSAGRHIVVIGTSAGGLEALDEVIGQRQPGFPAAIFIVQHLAPEATGEALLHRLARHKAFKCMLASDGDSFEDGNIYIARADYQLLIKKETLLVTKGARETVTGRPSIRCSARAPSRTDLG